MFKSLATAALIGAVSANNLITISLKPEAAQYMQGKGDILGAHIDAWFSSPEFKRFETSAKIFEASPIRKNLQAKEERFAQIGVETDKEIMDIAKIVD